jgi:hypothetical protein
VEERRDRIEEQDGLLEQTPNTREIKPERYQTRGHGRTLGTGLPAAVKHQEPSRHPGCTRENEAIVHGFQLKCVYTASSGEKVPPRCRDHDGQTRRVAAITMEGHVSEIMMDTAAAP